MKKICLITLALFSLSTNSFSQSVSVKGNGKIITETRDLSQFKKIANNGMFNIYVVQANNCSVKIETDENIIPVLDISVNNQTLFISVKKNYNINATKANLYITLNDLSLLSNNGIGNISIPALTKIKDFELQNNGTGNIDIGFDCSKFIITNNGIGNISYSGKTKEIQMNNFSTGTLNFNNLSADIFILNNSGIGQINLSGNVSSAIFTNSGTGKIGAFNLITAKLSVTNNGAGNVQVYAEQEISIISNGIGSIDYKGNAIVKQSVNYGMGKITKL